MKPLTCFKNDFDMKAERRSFWGILFEKWQNLFQRNAPVFHSLGFDNAEIVRLISSSTRIIRLFHFGGCNPDSVNVKICFASICERDHDIRLNAVRHIHFDKSNFDFAMWFPVGKHENKSASRGNAGENCKEKRYPTVYHLHHHFTPLTEVMGG